ncbi:MAG: DUF2779 domain-containing protein [Chloroflexi bacterium]|nr:DUF2779 domain-containing protein [Chloroflexota bacterium]
MAGDDIPLLSKSRFTSGLQCLRKLHLSCFQPELGTPPDAAQQSVFDAGTAVGEMARDLRPGGVLIDEAYYLHDEAVERTRRLLTDKSVPAIYEAAFTEDGVRVRADILARTSDGSWELIEVKSTMSAKKQHIPDVAVQLMVIEKAGLTIDRVSLAHLSRDYTYPGGEYEADQLLTIDDMTDDARAYVETIAGELAVMRDALAGDEPPDIAIGPHCRKPYKCEFFAHCRAREPYWSIEELPGLSAKKRNQLRDAGTLSILEIPDDSQLNAAQERARQSVITGRPQREGSLESELNKIETPAHFIDFETLGPALPVYPGTRPYEAVPFQWSDHVLHQNGNVTHSEFLADGSDDPRSDFVDSLVSQLEGAATIVVYSGYEETCLRGLQDELPDRAAALEKLLNGRWVDLLQIVRGHYYHRDFRGSFSLKSVLPALAPGVAYEDLEIRGGMVASNAYLESIRPETSARRRKKLRQDLLAYCARDTKAMLLIIDAMRGGRARPSDLTSNLYRALRALWPFGASKT